MPILMLSVLSRLLILSLFLFKHVSALSGVPPNYGSWNHWDMRRLQLPVSKPVTDSGTQVNGTTELALLEPKGNILSHMHTHTHTHTLI